MLPTFRDCFQLLSSKYFRFSLHKNVTSSTFRCHIPGSRILTKIALFHCNLTLFPFIRKQWLRRRCCWDWSFFPKKTFSRRFQTQTYRRGISSR